MIKYSGEDCHKCGKQIELELEDPSSPTEWWVPKSHDCIVHLKEEIDKLWKAIYDLQDDTSSLRYEVNPDDRRFH